MPMGRVLYSQDGGLHTLRYVGEIKYPIAPSIDRFVKTLIQNNVIDDLVVDLTETDSIDSTNLGELARIAQRLREQGRRRPVIVSPQTSINQLLRSMALDEVFDLTVQVQAFNGDDIPTDVETTREELAAVMLESHKSLAQVTEGNRQKFCDVIALLEKDANKPRGST